MYIREFLEKMMIVHPDPLWFNNLRDNKHDSKWVNDNIGEIIENFHYYLYDPNYLFESTKVLDDIFYLILDMGHYSLLKGWLLEALDIFDTTPVPYDIKTKIMQAGGAFTECYPTEYFRLRLYLADVSLARRETDAVATLLHQLLELLPTTSELNKLDTYFIILKYFSYGYEIKLDFDIVHDATELTIHKYPQRKLDLYIAVAYYHYSQSNVEKIQAMLDKIMRAMVKEVHVSSIDMVDVNRISAEQNYFLAVIYRELKQFDEAFQYLDRASEQYARLKNPVRNMLILHEKAVLYHFINQPEEAQQWLNLAYREYYQLEEPQTSHYAMLKHTQGLIHFDMMQYESALSLFHDSLDIWIDNQHKYHIALAHNVIGYTHYKMSQIDKALEFYDESHKLCRNLKEKHAQELMKVIEQNISDAKQFPDL